MKPRSEDSSLRRARLWTFVIVLASAGAIGLANLSSEPVTSEFLERTVLQGKTPQRAFGWPLTWYWRDRVENPASRWPVTSQWPVLRYSIPSLLTNAAVWSVLLAVAATACSWVFSRYMPRFQARLPITAFFALFIVSVLTVLANLSFDAQRRPWTIGEHLNYGWPLVWYWRVEIFIPTGPGAQYEEWDYRPESLAGNIAIWLALLAATARISQWLARRYTPRMCWSLRTLLIGVAVVAMSCAWFVAVRDRADKQDAFVEALHIYEDDTDDVWEGVEEDDIYVERRAPKWFSVIGADRFCRHIVGVRFATACRSSEVDENRELFKRLSQLPSLRLLDIEPDTHPRQASEFTPDMAAILGQTQQLRMLNFACQGNYLHSSLNAAREYLAAIGKLTRLERLRLSIWAENSRDLGYLASLTNLKTLALDIRPFDSPADPDALSEEGSEAIRALAYLSVLPQLEQFDLHDAQINAEDLDRLSAFTQLKSLNLNTNSIAAADLAKLAPLASLEELAIDGRAATAEGLTALAGIKRLHAVHVADTFYDEAGSGVALPLDNGDQLTVAVAEVDGVRRALEMLRDSHPRIVIDTNYADFEGHNDLQPPWDYFDKDVRAFAERWLYER